VTRAPQPQPLEQAGFVVTNLIKLGGLVLVFHDALTAPPGLDPVTLGIAAFMMAGAQGLDTFFQSFFGRQR
jgi:hypothetical protein